MKKNLKEKSTQIWQNSSVLQIGKKGVTNSFLEELKEQLNNNKYLKIKILKNSPFENRSDAFKVLKQKLPLDIEIVEKRGRTVIVTKRL
ncbi:MAG: YhbY family RNA-binding protein [Candidatus Hodarchaeota archaeon]